MKTVSKEIRNVNGRKLGAHGYASGIHRMEILSKGVLTTIYFLPDGSYRVTNTKMPAKCRHR